MKYVLKVEKIEEFKLDPRDMYRSPAQTPQEITVMFEAEIKPEQIDVVKKALEGKK